MATNKRYAIQQHDNLTSDFHRRTFPRTIQRLLSQTSSSRHHTMASDTKPAEQDKPTTGTAPAEAPKQPPKAAALGEDDEFEDFPVDGMHSIEARG